jgi:hypothetical protein
LTRALVGFSVFRVQRVWVVTACVLLAGCLFQQRPPNLSPRAAAYAQLEKGMDKLKVAQILRANRRVRFIQIGDPSDPRADLEYWYYSEDGDNDFVVFAYDGRLLQWEYHDPTDLEKARPLAIKPVRQ